MTAPPAVPMTEADRTLRARAKALARPATPVDPPDSMIELLEFRLAKESYAVESRYVQGVHPLAGLAPLPCTPPFLLGIVNVRGRILPVLDIRKFFELPESGLTDLHRIVLVEGHDLEVGLLADVVTGTRTLPLASLQAALPTLTGIRRDYLKGVTAEHLIVLDVSRILSDPRIVVQEEPEG